MAGFADVVKVVAPWIGTALGGPLGGLAVEAAAAALGLPEKTTEAIKRAVAGASPEQLLALKNADQQFAKDMQALGFQHVEALDRIAADDRASAREREKALKDRMPAVLALLVTVGYFATLAFMMRNALPAEGREPLLIMLGSLGTAWGGVIAYYFGTTAGSSRKTELIAKG